MAGASRLNLTKPEVAAMQAQYAYQQLVDADFAVDGCFFDNFFTSQSWVKQDIYGNAVSVDANDDGLPDDPVWLDAAWKKGVYDELRAFRKWMPWAIVTGHLPRPPDAELGQIFNGDSFGFIVPEVREGLNPFADFWGMYQPWYTLGQKPVVTMIEAAPPMQIGYGYGYDPLNTIPASTLEFARGDWPNMRFGLGMTLMNDGYFAYEYGDTYHGNDWWYDELDFDWASPAALPSAWPCPARLPATMSAMAALRTRRWRRGRPGSTPTWALPPPSSWNPATWPRDSRPCAPMSATQAKAWTGTSRSNTATSRSFKGRATT